MAEVGAAGGKKVAWSLFCKAKKVFILFSYHFFCFAYVS